MSLRRTGWFSPFLKLAKQKPRQPLIWLLALLVVFSFLSPLFLHTPKAEAAGNVFKCADDVGSAVNGPLVPDQSGGVKYSKDRTGVYVYKTGTQTYQISTGTGQNCGTKDDPNAQWIGPGFTQALKTTIFGSSSTTGGGGSTANLNFNWVNSMEIDASNTNKYVADPNSTTKNGQNIFYQSNNDEGACKDTVGTSSETSGNLNISIEYTDSVNTSDKAKSAAQSAYSYQNIKPNITKAGHVGNCWVINPVAITIGNPANSTLAPTTTSNTQPSCESAGGGALSWFICPVIEMVDSAVSWLDSQIQSLLITPNPDSITGLQQAWARVRNIALIILIPIMLVMVIGTALGFSFLDAYTVRRAMPRLLIAILFISLSWSITTFLVSFTNAIGQGVLGLVTQPFLQPPFQSVNDITLGSLLHVGTAATASWVGLAVFGGMFAVGLISLGVILSVALIVLIVLFLGFFLLTLRQILILALILLAPLAILSWIFPNNDKAWKLWWDSFSKLLLMFPLLMLILGIGKAFALIIRNSSGAYSGIDSLLIQVMIIIAYVAPIFFIPFAFRAAGGLFSTITGMVNDRSKGLFDRQKKYRQETRAREWDRKGGQRLHEARIGTYRKFQDKRGSQKGLAKFGSGLIMGAVGGSALEDQASARTAARAKASADRIATGKDGEYRGLMAKYAYDMGFEKAEAAGVAKIGSNGQRQYKSLGGAWVNEGEVESGIKRFGNDTYAQQAALSYEMKKAIKDEDIENIKSNYGAQVESLGMSDQQAFGAWTGAAFENQNQHLEFKHTKWKGAPRGSGGRGGLGFDGAAMASEIHERRGSYNMAQVSAHTIEQLSSTYDTADATTQQQIRDIAETFMSRYGAGGSAGGDDEAERQAREAAAIQAGVDPARAREESVRTATPGAAHVAQEVRKLAVKTGVYQPLPPGPRSPGPPPSIEQQS